MVICRHPKVLFGGLLVQVWSLMALPGGNAKARAIGWPAVCYPAGVSRRQAEARIPITLALATACVRLWAPSLP
jgi:hypothetical protein